ncbi:MAG: hypothetical protein ABH863_05360, partial [Candidatus Micrarchaeota archaeon]
FKAAWGTDAYAIDYLQKQGYGRKEAAAIATDLKALKQTEASSVFAKQWGFGATAGAAGAAAPITDIDAHVDNLAKKKVDFIENYRKTANPEALSHLAEYDPVVAAKSAADNELNLLKIEKKVREKSLTRLGITDTQISDLSSIQKKLDGLEASTIDYPSKNVDLADLRDQVGRMEASIGTEKLQPYRQLKTDLATLEQQLTNADVNVKKQAAVLRQAQKDLVEKGKLNVKNRLNALGNPATINTRAGSALTNDDLISKHGIKQSELAELTGQVESKTGKLSKGVGRYAPSILRGALAAIIPFLFHVDVRPVQATLDFRYPHHIVAFNQLEDRPSMRSICATSLESDECINELDVEKMCDKNTLGACIYLVKGTRFSTVEGYTLITGANKGAPTERIINSLFVSSVEPLKSKEVSPSSLKVEYLSNYQTFPVVAPEVSITLSDEQAAQALYDTLWDSCGIHDSCPGKVDGDFLNQIKGRLATDSKGALRDMQERSKYN